jgi:hypothetical protein
MVVHVCNPSYLGGRGKRISVRGRQPGQKHKMLSGKQTKSKKDWGMAQVVESLLNKQKALSLIPTTEKKKKKRKKYFFNSMYKIFKMKYSSSMIILYL